MALQIPRSEHLQLFHVSTSQGISVHSSTQTLVKKEAIKEEVDVINGELLELVKEDVLKRLLDTCIQTECVFKIAILFLPCFVCLAYYLFI